jgi:hypothetical protein
VVVRWELPGRSAEEHEASAFGHLRLHTGWRAGAVDFAVHGGRGCRRRYFDHDELLKRAFLFCQGGEAVKERSVSVILLSGGQGKRMGVMFYLMLQTNL